MRRRSRVFGLISLINRVVYDDAVACFLLYLGQGRSINRETRLVHLRTKKVTMNQKSPYSNPKFCSTGAEINLLVFMTYLTSDR